MADQRLEEYRAYYDARAERYANNPYKKHSYEAEKRLRDLFYQYDTIEEIGAHLGTLNIDCAFAVWRDQYNMESQYYESIQEPVRKKGADQILAELDHHSDITDMSTKINELTNKNSVEISSDSESGKTLLECWKQLDEIDVYSSAEVPDEYRNYMERVVSDNKMAIRKTIENSEETMKEWVNGWRLKPEIALEYRYRHLIPFSDDEVERHLQLLKEITKR